MRDLVNVVFDASPLITTCKFEAAGKLVIDHLLTGCEVLISPAVEDEVAILGARYPDGVVAGERIADGRIPVVHVKTRRWERHLGGYAMGHGERESINLCGQEPDIEALVTDDHLAFIAATRLGLKVWMLPDLVVGLMSRGLLTVEVARAILEVIRPRYRAGVVEHSLEKLQEGEEDAKSCDSSQGRDFEVG